MLLPFVFDIELKHTPQTETYSTKWPNRLTFVIRFLQSLVYNPSLRFTTHRVIGVCRLDRASDCPVKALLSKLAKNSAVSATSTTVVNSPSTVSFSITFLITSASEMPSLLGLLWNLLVDKWRAHKSRRRTSSIRYAHSAISRKSQS
jgi:hypothetical protein